MEKKHKLHLDVLRIIAAFFVIFNHTGGFSLFTDYTPDSFNYWAFLTLSVCCKVSVPLFFMISGALLLGKEDEKPGKLLQRVLRIVVVLVCFSFLSYLQQLVLGNEQLDLIRFFRVLIQSDWLNVYWYLYAYLAFLLCLPFLRAMAKNLKAGHYVYLFGLSVLIQGVIPVLFGMILGWDVSYNSSFSFNWLLGSVPLYPLMGYYLENQLEMQRVSWKKLALLWLAAAVGIGLTCYATYRDNAASGGFTQNYIMSFVMVSCTAMYLTAKKLFDRYETAWLTRLLTCVGGCSFGIYLLHGQILRTPFLRICYPLYYSGILHPMLQYLLLSADVMAVGFCLTWIMKKIPVVKNFL